MKTKIITNRFELAALLRRLYELDLDYEGNLCSNAQILAVPFLKKLISRLEKKVLLAPQGKDIKLSLSKYEIVAFHTMMQHTMEDMFYSSIYCKIEQKYCSIQGVIKIE